MSRYPVCVDTRIEIDLNARERRMYDRVRARLVSSVGDGQRSRMAENLLILPDMVVLLTRLLSDPRVPFSAKAVALGGVGYVLSPIDLLPEFLLGPVGFLDDALVIAAALSRLVNDVHPDVVRSHWPGKGDALESIQGLTDWAEQMITNRMPPFMRRWLGVGH
jgi:uncharacterized membrane protein YkvA (DUF1232 family)